MLISSILWLPWIGEFLVVSDPDCRGEVALVLGGDGGGWRLLKAASLVREGRAGKVLLNDPGGGYGNSATEAAMDFAERHGYEKALFVSLPLRAKSTKSEAAETAQELQKRGIHRFILVTSDFHTRRATRIFRRTLQATDVAFCTVAASTPWLRADRWYATRTGREIVLTEWSKTMANWLGM